MLGLGKKIKTITMIFKEQEAAASIANMVRNTLKRVRETEHFSTQIKLTTNNTCVEFPDEKAVLSAVKFALQKSSAVKSFKSVDGCSKKCLGL